MVQEVLKQCKPATDAACIAMRFDMIKGEIAACKTYQKVKACEDATTLLLEAPYGDKAFHEIQQLKQMAAKKDASIRRRALLNDYSEQIYSLCKMQLS